MHIVIDQSNITLFFFSLVTIRVVNSPERTETDLITGLDQTVRAVHSCNSWFAKRLLYIIEDDKTSEILFLPLSEVWSQLHHKTEIYYNTFLQICKSNNIGIYVFFFFFFFLVCLWMDG